MPGPSSSKKNETEVTNLDGPINPLRTHQMRTRSQRQVNALALVKYYDRLNDIIKQTYHCVLPTSAAGAKHPLQRHFG